MQSYSSRILVPSIRPDCRFAELWPAARARARRAPACPTSNRAQAGRSANPDRPVILPWVANVFAAPCHASDHDARGRGTIPLGQPSALAVRPSVYPHVCVSGHPLRFQLSVHIVGKRFTVHGKGAETLPRTTEPRAMSHEP